MKKETTALLIKKASDVEVILNNGFAATSANNNGAINIWFDHDNQSYNCERMRHFKVLDVFSSEEIEPVIKWTEKDLELIRRTTIKTGIS